VPLLLVQNFVFCTVIALILWQMVPSIGQYGFYNNFIHAQAIGNTICALAIASGVFASRLNIVSRWFTVISVLLITTVGIYAGMALASWWLDLPDSTFRLMERDQWIASATTAAIASIAFNWHVASKQKLLKLELVASEERRKADSAHHAMLRAQLEPHMLFNTLANLRALIAIDPDRAIEMLDRLDNFLRATLSSSQSASNTLQHEFGFLDDYLALMGIRLGERLNYTLELPDNCKDVVVPSLILQPLVENAIRHGIEPQIEGGQIVVSAALSEDMLTLVVTDSGIGMSQSAIADANSTVSAENTTQRGGFGLQNLRDRLSESLADKATLNIESSATDPLIEGTRITLQLSLT